MPTTVSPTQDAVIVPVINLLELIVGSPVVFQSQTNRVPMPNAPSFIMLTDVGRVRLATNEDKYVPPLDPANVGSVESKTSTQLTMQADIYGPDSSEWVQMVLTVFRGRYACDYLESSQIQPLYTSEPRQSPLTTGELQFLDRWTIDLVLQYNPVTVLPMEFGNKAPPITLIDVDANYPPN